MPQLGARVGKEPFDLDKNLLDKDGKRTPLEVGTLYSGMNKASYRLFLQLGASTPVVGSESSDRIEQFIEPGQAFKYEPVAGESLFAYYKTGSGIVSVSDVP